MNSFFFFFSFQFSGSMTNLHRLEEPKASCHVRGYCFTELLIKDRRRNSYVDFDYRIWIVVERKKHFHFYNYLINDLEQCFVVFFFFCCCIAERKTLSDVFCVTHGIMISAIYPSDDLLKYDHLVALHNNIIQLLQHIKNILLYASNAYRNEFFFCFSPLSFIFSIYIYIHFIVFWILFSSFYLFIFFYYSLY